MSGGLGVFGFPTFIPPQESIDALGIDPGRVLYDIKMIAIIVVITMIIAFAATMVLYKEETLTAPQTGGGGGKAPGKPMEKSDIAGVEGILAAPLSGHVIPLSEVKDEAFSSGVLGHGLAIVPTEGKVYAPCDGVISALFPTGHAIGITAANSAEVLLHIGMDTVKLEGKYFRPKVEAGASVKTGDLLLEFDMEKIKEAGYDVTTPILITNYMQFADVSGETGKDVKAGQALISII